MDNDKANYYCICPSPYEGCRPAGTPRTCERCCGLVRENDAPRPCPHLHVDISGKCLDCASQAEAPTRESDEEVSVSYDFFAPDSNIPLKVRGVGAEAAPAPQAATQQCPHCRGEGGFDGTDGGSCEDCNGEGTISVSQAEAPRPSAEEVEKMAKEFCESDEFSPVILSIELPKAMATFWEWMKERITRP